MNEFTIKSFLYIMSIDNEDSMEIGVTFKVTLHQYFAYIANKYFTELYLVLFTQVTFVHPGEQLT